MIRIAALLSVTVLCCSPAELQVAARITDETLMGICALQPLEHGVLHGSITLHRNPDGELTPVKPAAMGPAGGGSFLASPASSGAP